MAHLVPYVWLHATVIKMENSLTRVMVVCDRLVDSVDTCLVDLPERAVRCKQRLDQDLVSWLNR